MLKRDMLSGNMSFDSKFCESYGKEFIDDLFGKYLFTAKKSKLKILHRNFCLSKKEDFMKQPVQKTGRRVPG